jgi:hypothetical protein
MKVSFDGLRQNMVNAYKTTISAYREVLEEYGPVDSLTTLAESLDEQRQMIAALLCCYDPESIESDNDFHDLADLAYSLPFADPRK